jgi:hypothetical protein
MKNKVLNKIHNDQRGVALVVVIMVTLLLLVAGIGLLATTSAFSGDVSDANAEQQAYYASEGGVQTALNVLRGNVAPNPLINSTAASPLNKISFRKALTLATSNTNGDTSTTSRLSRWIPYTGNNASIGNGSFLLEIIDPDNTPLAQEPTRLIVRSTGFFGGASKRIEAILVNSSIGGLTAPAPLVLVGPNPGVVFDAGSSNSYLINGTDVSNPATVLPPIAVTNAGNLSVVNSSPRADQFVPTPPGPANVGMAGLPPWLQNPTNLDSKVQELRSVAQNQSRYFTTATASSNMNLGSDASPTITFVDGDLTLSPSGTSNGAGILVVSGKLTLSGGFSYKGIILVTGSNGARINGGGGGSIEGMMVVAPYNPASLAAGFTAPQYDRGGGGNSMLTYNSQAITNAVTGLGGMQIVGIAEK